MKTSHVGANIKKYRVNCQLTQAQLAELLDISTIHMSHLETNSSTMSLDLLLKLCDVLNITPNHLLLPESEVYRDPHLMEELFDGLSARERKFAFDLISLLKSAKLDN